MPAAMRAVHAAWELARPPRFRARELVIAAGVAETQNCRLGPDRGVGRTYRSAAEAAWLAVHGQNSTEGTPLPPPQPPRTCPGKGGVSRRPSAEQGHLTGNPVSSHWPSEDTRYQSAVTIYIRDVIVHCSELHDLKFIRAQG